MPASYSFDLGVAINGADPNPNPNRLSADYAWRDAAFSLACDHTGSPDPNHIIGGPADGPNRLVWKQSGAPFGSVQTQFSVVSGALPPGMYLVHKEVRALAPGGFNPWPIGVLNEFGFAGVPLAAGVYTFSVGASGAFGGDSYTVTIALSGSCPLIDISSGRNGYLGVAYSRTFTAENGDDPYIWDVALGSLPPGLSLSSGGVLSGTPTLNGTYTFTIRATDDDDCPGVREITMTISTPRRTQVRGSTQIKASSVTEDELNPSVAGYGLKGGGGAPLSVDIAILSTRPVFFPDDPEDGMLMPGGSGSGSGSGGGDIRSDGSVPFTNDQSMGGNKLTDLDTPSASDDAATKGYVDAVVSGGADRGFFGVGGGIHTLVAGPITIKPTGTTLTFIVGIGSIGTGDATVYANVQLTDLFVDDANAVINNSLVSFGGQHLFGLVHFTGLTAGKEYVCTLQYSARRNAAAIGGGVPFLLCLDLVTAAAAATVETAQASSSATFADLATAGPSVTATVPGDGVAAIMVGDSENRVQTGTSALGVVISGANTRAADSIAAQSTSGAQNIALQGGLVLSRLSSGSTTFKLQYQSDGGSNTRYARWLAVLFGVFGGTPVTFGVSKVTTSETTASTSYVALTTADSVTLTTRTEVLVLFSVNTRGSGVIDTSVAVDVSGATTVAAADGVSNAKAITATTQTWHVGRGVVFTGLNAGSNTFALRYKVSGGTGTFLGRILAVIRLN